MLNQNLKLNLGCGTVTPDGWINIDSSPNVLVARLPGSQLIKDLFYKLRLMSENGYNAKWSSSTIFCNLAKNFPKVSPDTCGIIYTSHFLEHIPRDSTLRLIKKCYIALSSGGILRIAVPDLYVEAKKYVTQVDVAIKSRLQDCSASEQFIQDMVSRSRRHSHVWMYDFFSLSRILRESGFINIEQKKFHQSMIEDIKLVEKREESLFVECEKP